MMFVNAIPNVCILMLHLLSISNYFSTLFMNKRTFIKLSSTLMVAPLVYPIKDILPDEKLINWAGNIEYSTDKIIYPESVGEVQQLVKAHSKLKVLGTRHCFNRIADSKDYFVSSRKLNKVISLDKDARTVTVEGGI